MPFFSQNSTNKLESCHADLQLIAKATIIDSDFAVLCGHRSPETQFELFKKGRKLKNGLWVISDKSKIVTYRDGYKVKSEHNFLPAKAFDVVPFPIDWKNIQRFFVLANIMKAHAMFLLNIRKIKHRLIWGGDWDMRDYPHFQLEKI